MVPAQYGLKARPEVVTSVHSPNIEKVPLFVSPETVTLPLKLYFDESLQLPLANDSGITLTSSPPPGQEHVPESCIHEEIESSAISACKAVTDLDIISISELRESEHLHKRTRLKATTMMANSADDIFFIGTYPSCNSFWAWFMESMATTNLSPKQTVQITNTIRKC